jgi:hypothetical protein
MLLEHRADVGVARALGEDLERERAFEQDADGCGTGLGDGQQVDHRAVRVAGSEESIPIRRMAHMPFLIRKRDGMV